jgi:hypothetical protein
MNPYASPLASLRRFMRPGSAEAEQCELCGAALGPSHPHLVELARRRLTCACDACAVLFSSQAAGTYRRVPQEVELLPDFSLTDVQWQGLGPPINLAFFMQSSQAGCVQAFYPSPAGATEAAPPLDAWEEIVTDNPVLGELEPDVEALLVNRLGKAPEYYRLGIDRCYELVGLLRTHWRGFSGGDAVWQEIGRFFSTLKDQAHA